MSLSKIYSGLGLFLILLGIFFVLIIKLQPSWQITGDGFGYYSFLRSIYFDNDLDFYNEYKYYDSVYNSHLADIKLTPVNKLGNVFAVGLSIVWLPFFLLARIVDFFIKLSPNGLEGLGINYQIALGLGSIIYTIGGLLLLFDSLKKFFTRRLAWLSVLIIVFISPLPHYLIYEPHMSHGASFAGISLLIWLSIKIYQSTEKIKTITWLFLGATLGLTILLRWQNIIFWLIPLLIIYQKYKQQLIKPINIILLLMVALLFFSPQLVVWKILYGSFLTIPQGSGFLYFFNPQVWQFLFSGFHGLFFWHPWLLLGIIGLIWSYQKNRAIFWTLFLILIFQIYINSIVRDWWAGHSFGSRRMIETLPIFAYGLAFLLEKFPKKWQLKSLLCFFLLGSIFNILVMVSAPRGYIHLEKHLSPQQYYLAPLQMLKDRLK